jgi:hypothetical protein
MVAQAQPALAGNGIGHWWPSKSGCDMQMFGIAERRGATAGQQAQPPLAGVTSHA